MSPFKISQKIVAEFDTEEEEKDEAIEGMKMTKLNQSFTDLQTSFKDLQQANTNQAEKIQEKFKKLASLTLDLEKQKKAHSKLRCTIKKEKS